MYDSASDSSVEESLEDTILSGSFSKVDEMLRDGVSLGILNSPRWDIFIADFLSLENWRSKIRSIQLLYIYHCIRQLERTSMPAVYLMEMKCNVNSWLYIAVMDAELFVERLAPYLVRFDDLAMSLYRNILAMCMTEPTHVVTIPDRSRELSIASSLAIFPS